MHNERQKGTDRWRRTIGAALLLAGQMGQFKQDDPLAVLEGRTPSRLVMLDPASGEKQSETALAAPPVFDARIAAHGALFIAQTDGKIVCAD